MNTHNNTNKKVTDRGSPSRGKGETPMNVGRRTLALLGIAGALGIMTTLATDPVSAPAGLDDRAAAATIELRSAATATADRVAAATADGRSTALAGSGEALRFDVTESVVAAAAEQERPARRAPAKTERDVNIDPASKMSGRLAAIAAAGGDAPVEVVVSYADHPELFDDARVAELGGEVVRAYNHLAMRAIRVPAGSLNELALETRIDRLSLDAPVVSLSESARLTANVPGALSVNAVFEGAGVGVAIIDSGVSMHGALADSTQQFSFLNGNYPVPNADGIVDTDLDGIHDFPRIDQFGHGTHVAGVISGAPADSGGEFAGSSQQVGIVSLRVLNNQGSGQMSDVMAALDWVLAFGNQFGIRVVNLSLGKTVSESNKTDPLVLAAEALWDAGVVVVVAAGNDGQNGNFTINSPGNSRKIITVGSLTDAGTGADITDDYVSSFSSRGPSVGDLVLKPDLVAPGNKVTAAIPNGSQLLKLLPQRANNCAQGACSQTYLELSGTSMATPMVAAAAARMLAKDPTLTPDTVKARLMRSARKVNGEPTSYGAGVLDFEAAMNETGIVMGQALSPIMIKDSATNGILIEDTATNWGGTEWSANYLYYSGFNWAPADGTSTQNALTTVSSTGFLWSDEVDANGFLWSDEGVWANGYLWSDEGGTGEDVWARGFLWSDEGGGTGAKSLLDTDWESMGSLNDDP